MVACCKRSSRVKEKQPFRRMELHEITKDLAAVAMGRQSADLIIRNSCLVNVNTGMILENTDVAVRHGYIALVGNADHVKTDENTDIVDAEKRYLVPGFIDSHMHVESTMVDLPGFARGVIPRGTTAIAPDNHEMTNVFGLKAVELFKKTAEGLPLKVFTAMPVCVPSIPGFEDAGAVITAEEAALAYSSGWADLQGEQMNFPGVIYGDPGVHEITSAGLKAGKVLTGHYAGNDLNAGLNAFIASGMTACHEAVTSDGALRRAELGMYVQQRYGSAWLDLPNLIKAVTENPGIDTRMFTLVTDDVTPLTVAEEGHLDRVVRKAVSLGVPPVTAIQMATINPAQMLGLSGWIGSISPGRAADMLLLSSLEEVKIDRVYCDGRLAAENNRLKADIKNYNYPKWALNSVHLKTLSESDFRIESAGTGPVKVRAIEVFPGMVHTREKVIEVTPLNGALEADAGNDISKAAVFYRHGALDESAGTRGLGFVKGAGFRPGCAYASTVSHDCHNLLVVGNGDAAMAAAANRLIESGGGIAVVSDNTLEAVLPLPLAGLMSLESVETLALQVSEIEKALVKAGCPGDSFEMTLSLLGLIVIEELHLSNRGLVQLKEGKPPVFVDLIISG